MGRVSFSLGLVCSESHHNGESLSLASNYFCGRVSLGLGFACSESHHNGESLFQLFLWQSFSGQDVSFNLVG